MVYAGAFVGLGKSLNQFEDVDGFIGAGAGYGFDYDDTAPFIGGLVGIKFEFQRVGVSAELDYARLDNTSEHPADPSDIDETIYSELEDLIALRTRLSYAVSDRWQVFAMAGGASGQIKNQFTDLDWYWIDEAAGIAGLRFDADDSFSDRSWQFGWLVGAGSQWTVSDHWALRADITFLDFGTQDYWVNHKGFTNSKGVFIGARKYSVENQFLLSRVALVRHF